MQQKRSRTQKKHLSKPTTEQQLLMMFQLLKGKLDENGIELSKEETENYNAAIELLEMVAAVSVSNTINRN